MERRGEDRWEEGVRVGEVAEARLAWTSEGEGEGEQGREALLLIQQGRDL